jgi:hypothetical protein
LVTVYEDDILPLRQPLADVFAFERSPVSSIVFDKNTNVEKIYQTHKEPSFNFSEPLNWICAAKILRMSAEKKVINLAETSGHRTSRAVSARRRLHSSIPADSWEDTSDCMIGRTGSHGRNVRRYYDKYLEARP